VLEILTFQQDLKSSINLQVPDDRKQRSTWISFTRRPLSSSMNCNHT
jgi:hypothetical protein